MKYVNRQNGIKAELIQESEKFKTVLLKLEDGTEKQITTATLKRWWKVLPEEEVVKETPVQVEEPQEVETEDRCSDGTTYKQVAEEIREGAKRKAHIAQAKRHLAEVREKKSRKGKAPVEKIDVTPVLQYVEEVAGKHGLIKCIREKQPALINYKLEDSPVLFYTFGQKRSLWIFAKSKQLGSLAKDGQVVNCLFDRKYNITEFNDETKGLVDKLIKAVVLAQTQKKEEK